jgi:hypothetical protein
MKIAVHFENDLEGLVASSTKALLQSFEKHGKFPFEFVDELNEADIVISNAISVLKSALERGQDAMQYVYRKETERATELVQQYPDRMRIYGASKSKIPDLPDATEAKQYLAQLHESHFTALTSLEGAPIVS